MRGLGYLDDCDDDLALPVRRETISAYWHARQPELIREIARAGLA